MAQNAHPQTSRVQSWGMVQWADCLVRRPKTVDDILVMFDEARALGLKVGLRGAGNSYGDASLNDGGFLLDFTGMNRILDWNPETGVIEAEPGVTIGDVWRHVISDGYWLPVVPGTMSVSLAGAAAMNIHGKNNFNAGTFGEHVLEFDLVTPSGEVVACSREENAEIFGAAIGGLGVLGVFSRLKVKLKKVASGLLRVTPHAVSSFGEAISKFRELCPGSDYAVGWHDAFGRGESLGRGLMHTAVALDAGEDAHPEQTLRPEHQALPSRLFGVVPRSWMWMGLWFFMNNPGMRLMNRVKFQLGRRKSGCRHLQSHAGFHFLLDYVPNWKCAYKPGGLIQYQPFVPDDRAAGVFSALVQLAGDRGLPPYLLVTKRHRMDPFLMTHAVDGFSLAMDFRVTRRNRDRVWNLAREMDEIVLGAGGRFYFAKDSVMRPDTLRQCYPPERVGSFLSLKDRLDPDGILQTDLFRRVFDPPVQ